MGDCDWWACVTKLACDINSVTVACMRRIVVRIRAFASIRVNHNKGKKKCVIKQKLKKLNSRGVSI